MKQALDSLRRLLEHCSDPFDCETLSARSGALPRWPSVNPKQNPDRQGLSDVRRSCWNVARISLDCTDVFAFRGPKDEEC